MAQDAKDGSRRSKSFVAKTRIVFAQHAALQETPLLLGKSAWAGAESGDDVSQVSAAPVAVIEANALRELRPDSATSQRRHPMRSPALPCVGIIVARGLDGVCKAGGKHRRELKEVSRAMHAETPPDDAAVVPFDCQHPLASSCVQVVALHTPWAVPRFIGSSLPDPSADVDRFAQVTLLLLKPWRRPDLRDLLHPVARDTSLPASSWATALAEYELSSSLTAAGQLLGAADR